MVLIPLAQIDLKPGADGLGSNFLPWACAILIAALVYVVKHAVDTNAKHAGEIAALQLTHATALEKVSADRLADVKADAKEQREILNQIVPLSAKLVEGLEILERLTKE